jgi:hypothetical protein
MTGLLTLSGTPTSASHAVTKQYVDNLASGLLVKEAARTATSSNITATYVNGTNGVGATLTGTGALGAINGVTLVVGDRILVKNQTTAGQNGMYELTTLNPFVLTRTTDFNSTASIQAGDAFFVGEGTLASTQWIMTTAGTVTVGTSSIAFTQFGGPNSFVGGTGIGISSNTINNTGVLSVTGGGAVSASTTNGVVTLGFTQPTVPTTAGGTGLTSIGAALQVLRVKSDTTGLEWATASGGGGSGTVTGVSVVSANGLNGSVANNTTTPAITLSTTVNGLLLGNSSTGAISAATIGSGLSLSNGTLTATGGGGGSANIEVVTFRYAPGSTANLASDSVQAAYTTSGVTATITDTAACSVTFTFTGYTKPPKSITTYGQNFGTNAFAIRDITSQTNASIIGTGTSALPGLVTGFTSSNIFTLPALTMANTGAAGASLQRAWLIIVFGF